MRLSVDALSAAPIVSLGWADRVSRAHGLETHMEDAIWYVLIDEAFEQGDYALALALLIWTTTHRRGERVPNA